VNSTTTRELTDWYEQHEFASVAEMNGAWLAIQQVKAIASQRTEQQAGVAEPAYDKEQRRLVDDHPLGALLRWQEQRIKDLTYLLEQSKKHRKAILEDLPDDYEV